MNKVFGIGLQRTGTTSLYVALHHLGVHIVHYPHDDRTYEQLIHGDYELDVVKQCDGACDLSVAPFYVELDEAFPGSKFILTERDVNSWLRSVNYHWLGNHRDWRDGMETRSKFALFITAVTFGTFYFQRERFAHIYEKHTKSVMEYFKDRPDDLLVMNICDGDGWEKLCGFLGKDIPDVEFPHRNKASYTPLLM